MQRLSGRHTHLLCFTLNHCIIDFHIKAQKYLSCFLRFINTFILKSMSELLSAHLQGDLAVIVFLVEFLTLSIVSQGLVLLRSGSLVEIR